MLSARPGRSGPGANAWTTNYVVSAVVFDFLVVLAGALLGFVLRFPGAPQVTNLPYFILTFALPFLWVLVLAVCRAYDPGVFGEGSEEYRRVFNAGFVLIASIAILAYAMKVDVARGYVMTALPLATLLDLFCRYFLRRRLHALRARGRCMRDTVVVGHGHAADELIRQLRREPRHGLNVVAVCLPAGPLESEEIRGVPVLGDFGEAADVARLLGARTVAVLACPEMDAAALRRLAWKLESDEVELCVAPALMDVAGPRISIRPVAGLPLLHVEHPELSGGRRLVKGLFDRSTALLLLVLLAPLFLLIAGTIRCSGRGPVLFRQVRVGKDGRTFVVFKFRSMVEGAEQMLDPLQNDGDGVIFKIKRDPRVTPIGARLRKYSLDELPQLLNVLRGEMSLVGPRPPLPEEVRRFPEDVLRRLAVKPGMTGLWQVSGRSDLSWDDSVRLDLRYVENWSLALDLQIMWRTTAIIVRGSGAY
ncbi:sugar transferase [Actinocorallia sp. B10E7]|uniref:sugar transferase n=1 Tax=Actinocorallia sp. B10E7 TaxID=3153558 RepID=UPI00325EBA61